MRATTASDAADYRALRLEALADSPDAFGTTLEEARGYDDARWVTLAEGGRAVLAWRDGRVVGMAAGAGHDRHPGTSWLFGMYVTPAERGRGVAEALVAAVARRARSDGATALYLQVTGAMGRARAFYARLGFEPTGERDALRRNPAMDLATLAMPFTREPVRVRRVDAATLVHLRTRVLREGDPAREARHPRDDDPTSWHFGAFVADALVGCASFYPATWPLDQTLAAHQLRYMAVEPSVQGHGVGRILLDHAEAILRANGIERLWAHARDTALGFYLATGWRVVAGSEHDSVETGLPHTTVTKVLAFGGAALR